MRCTPLHFPSSVDLPAASTLALTAARSRTSNSSEASAIGHLRSDRQTQDVAQLRREAGSVLSEVCLVNADTADLDRQAKQLVARVWRPDGVRRRAGGWVCGRASGSVPVLSHGAATLEHRSGGRFPKDARPPSPSHDRKQRGRVLQETSPRQSAKACPAVILRIVAHWGLVADTLCLPCPAWLLDDCAANDSTQVPQAL